MYKETLNKLKKETRDAGGSAWERLEHFTIATILILSISYFLGHLLAWIIL